jgi:uroporphyrinogen-III synthase
MPVSKNILITRKLRPDSLFFEWAAKSGYRIADIPFIKFEPVTGLEIPETDWIFFSSPTGAKLYLETYPLKAKRVAALSTGTSSVLRENGIFPDFTGTAKKEPSETGTAFFSLLEKQQTVLFPLSSISKKSVSSLSDSARTIEMVTYRTTLDPKPVDLIPAAIVFTSPSNVQGFLAANNLDPQTKVITIGKTTGSELSRTVSNEIHFSESAEEGDIISLLDKIL